MEFMIVGIVMGLIVGGASSWLIRSARAKVEVADSQAEYIREVENLKGQLQQTDSTQAILDAAKTQLSETFQATASQALQSSNKQFLQLAQQSLGTTLESAKSEFYQRHLQFQELVKPLSENYGKLNPQIETLTTQMQSITAETAKLSGALSDTRQVGSWGEVQLRRVVELAGMTQYCDFDEQKTSANSRARPDLIVNLPERRAIVVDAKASIVAYMEAYQTSDEEASDAIWIKHADALKRQVNNLASKHYETEIEGALNFVVMFVPGDQFLAAALSTNPDLIEYAMGKQVAIATPASLIAMLWAVNQGWQQIRFAESAQQIKDVGEEMHKRMMIFISHYQNVGRDLNRTVAAFNKSIGSFDERVVPQGRRFSELVIGDTDRFLVPEVINETPRISRHVSQSYRDDTER